MRSPGAVLLVSCYELGHQPLGLAEPLAILRAAGYAPAAVDTAVEPLPDTAVVAARLVAISVPMHTALRLGVAVARRVRALNPAARVVCYGLYAALNARYLLREAADAVLGGEVEPALLALVRALEDGPWVTDSPDDPIPGVTTRAVVSPPALTRAPFAVPARDTLPPLDRYARLRRGDEALLAGYVEATRGCLHTCRHCPITPVYGGRFFAVPRAIVLDDIRQQVRAGARHITFGDPDFLNGPTHSLRITRALHAEFPDVTFDATIKVEHILEHRALFPELRDLGCAFIVSAVESLSDTVLSRLDKGHTRADVAVALDILRAAAIPLRPTLVAFTPWTTLDDYLDVLDFVAAHGLIDQVDPIQYAIRLLVPPGSALLDLPDAPAWRGALDDANFTYRWDHPDPRMDQLYHHVSAAVEAGRAAGADSSATFAAVRGLALSAAGRPVPTVPDTTETDRELVLAARRPVPHLTESWFC
jgi:radical SAM superfamily enzyme YgiQ (UPF0313 family)